MPHSDSQHTARRAFAALAAALLAAALGAAAWFASGFREYEIQGAADAASIEPPRSGVPRLDTAAQSILLIGDSMAYSLMFRAQNYCSANGHSLNVVSWVSATSRTFALCDTMEYFVNLYKPTYIIFVIGANEMFKPKALSRKEYFDMILPQTHGIPMVVVGPPNWREDTGINRAMMEMFGPRQFFLSKKLRYTRIKGDFVHPDRASGTMWMDSISAWIMRDSFFPIRMEKPVEENPVHVDFVKLVLTDPSLS